MQKNIEIKARSNNQEEIREILKKHKADFMGTDHQIDTYFKVNSGRLKLREGEIDGSWLIYYNRENKKGPKQSDVILHKLEKNSIKSLKEILIKTFGILVIVDKRREIYFIDNVKFHIDIVENLGAFVEIEAIDKEGNIEKEKLQKQCDYFIDLLKIPKESLISFYYSDLLLNIN